MTLPIEQKVAWTNSSRQLLYSAGSRQLVRPAICHHCSGLPFTPSDANQKEREKKSLILFIDKSAAAAPEHIVQIELLFLLLLLSGCKASESVEFGEKKEKASTAAKPQPPPPRDKMPSHRLILTQQYHHISLNRFGKFNLLFWLARRTFFKTKIQTPARKLFAANEALKCYRISFRKVFHTTSLNEYLLRFWCLMVSRSAVLCPNSPELLR